MTYPHHGHCLLDRRNNVGIGGTAAEVAAHQLADFVVGLRLASAISPAAEQICPGVQ